MEKTVLITGASSGIGFELARCFAREGAHLLLVAKPEAELTQACATLQSEFPHARIVARAQDLSVPDAARQLYDWTRASGYVVFTLVNNAGFGTYGFFNDIDPERDREMFRLNILAVYELTRLFAGDMIARDEGRILNMSSTAANITSPLLSSYSATKAFVYQMSMGYDYELRRRGSKVRIMALCPPPTRTGFQTAAHMEKVPMYQGFWSLDARQVAEEGYRALLKGRREIIPGPLVGTLMRILNRILPTRFKLWWVYQTLKEQN